MLFTECESRFVAQFKEGKRLSALLSWWSFSVVPLKSSDGGYTIHKKLLNLRNGVEKFPALNLIKWEVRIDDRWWSSLLIIGINTIILLFPVIVKGHNILSLPTSMLKCSLVLCGLRNKIQFAMTLIECETIYNTFKLLHVDQVHSQQILGN